MGIRVRVPGGGILPQPTAIDLRFARLVAPSKGPFAVRQTVARQTSAAPSRPANSFARRLTAPGPAPLEVWIGAWENRLRERGILRPPSPPVAAAPASAPANEELPLAPRPLLGW